MENNELDILRNEIKEIISSCLKKSGMFELDTVTNKLAEWHIDKTLELLNLLKSNITKYIN